MSQQLDPGQPIALNPIQNPVQSIPPTPPNEMFVSNDDPMTTVSPIQPQPVQQPIQTNPQPIAQGPLSRVATGLGTNHTQQPQSPASSPFASDFDDEDEEELDDTSFPPFPKIQPPSTGLIGKPPGQASLSLSKMPEDQRRDTITRVFKLVLGKDPIDKDFNYYRFSALNEDGLIRNLLNLQEHKNMIEQAKQFTPLKSANNEMEMKVKYLEMHVNSIQNEMATLQHLLAEKNRYIQNLRSYLQNVNGNQFPIPPEPQVFPEQIQPQSQPVQANQYPQSPGQAPNFQQVPHYPQPQVPQQQQVSSQKNLLPTPMDELKNMVKKLFSR